MNDFLQAAATRSGTRRREQVHPKKRNRLVVFLQFSSRGGKCSQGVPHLVGSLLDRGRFREINPRHMQVRSMMEVLTRDLASFERARQFDISHAHLLWTAPR